MWLCVSNTWQIEGDTWQREGKFGNISEVRKSEVRVGVFPKFSGEEFDNFTALAEKLRADYDFGHTLNAKHLPRGESSVAGPVIRLFKPFDELFVDSKDFQVNTLEKFVEESSIPVVTIFNNDPNNHPFVVKFFNSPNAKAMLFINFTAESAESFKSKYHTPQPWDHREDPLPQLLEHDEHPSEEAIRIPN